jgi:LacI family transcriptional regulator
VAEKHLTINDIARLAGVSKATVSRVLNQKPDVDSATRERILHVMKEQGFVPSASATDLAGGRSHLVGMLVRSYTWLFVLEILRAVADFLDETSYELVLYRMNDRLPEPEGAQATRQLLATNLTSGLLAVFPGQAAPFLVPLSQQAVPLVVIDDQYLLDVLPGGDAPIPWIASDNRTGAYEATRHLIEHGHRRIAHIHGPRDYFCARERHAGYCQAMQEAGLPVDEALVQSAEFTTIGGRAVAESFFSLPPAQRPTAIFASSDLMAYGVLAAAQQAGVSIPGDVALVGFDDLAEATETLGELSQVQLPLTTVRQPFYEMGRSAIELLLSLLETPLASGSRRRNWPAALVPVDPLGRTHLAPGSILRFQLPVKLMVRASCGCAAAAAAS